eukprot:1136445-Pelagomonas_calceolata.AAC.2
MSDYRKYTFVFPLDFERSREQHYFGNGVRGHVRYVHDMLCASILGTIGMYALQSFKTATAHPCMICVTCKHETSDALHCLSILQTVVTRLQTPYQRL